jgi:hypothetical protein
MLFVGAVTIRIPQTCTRGYCARLTRSAGVSLQQRESGADRAYFFRIFQAVQQRAVNDQVRGLIGSALGWVLPDGTAPALPGPAMIREASQNRMDEIEFRSKTAEQAQQDDSDNCRISGL